MAAPIFAEPGRGYDAVVFTPTSYSSAINGVLLALRKSRCSGPSREADKLNSAPFSPRFTDQLFRHKNESIAMVALLPDADGETLVQWGFDTFKKISALRFWSQLIATGLVCVLILSSVVLAPVWICRKLFSKSYKTRPVLLRAWAAAAAALLVTFDLLILWAFRGVVISKYFPDSSLGTVNPLTAGIMLTSLAFPVVAMACLWVAWRERNTLMKRQIYWQSVLVGLAALAVAVYYAFWGLIGLRLWA